MKKILGVLATAGIVLTMGAGTSAHASAPIGNGPSCQVTGSYSYYPTVGHPLSIRYDSLPCHPLDVTVAGLIGTLIAGYFADRMPKKRIVYISCTILALAAASIAFIHTMTAVLILAFIFGVGWGAFSAVDWALAVNLLPKGGTARYMAVWHMCLTVPQIIAPAFGPIGDHLNAAYGHGFGWRAAMMSTVLYLVIGTVLLNRIKERTLAN